MIVSCRQMLLKNSQFEYNRVFPELKSLRDSSHIFLVIVISS